MEQAPGRAVAGLMNGTVGILNVGAGDTKLTFDKSNPAERERAGRIVQDMLSRGYAILIQVGEKGGEPLYQRAKAFDPETCEYIITAGPDEEINVGELIAGEQKPAEQPVKPRRGPYRTRRVPADTTRAVSVGRTSGD